jgi:hypothetical protein
VPSLEVSTKSDAKGPNDDGKSDAKDTASDAGKSDGKRAQTNPPGDAGEKAGGEAKRAATNPPIAATNPPIDTAAAPDSRPDEKADTVPTAKADAPTGEVPREARVTEPPPIDPPPPKGEPWPDATPQPMRPVEPARARADTIAMPAELISQPPEMPATKPAGSVEDPTYMPGPRDIPDGNPTDPGTVPGRVPPGDSRSLRRGNEFALIYRIQTCVITRFGVAGTRGQWRVVEYPTSASASNSYAKEVSRWVGEGYSDYRD